MLAYGPQNSREQSSTLDRKTGEKSGTTGGQSGMKCKLEKNPVHWVLVQPEKNLVYPEKNSVSICRCSRRQAEHGVLPSCRISSCQWKDGWMEMRLFGQGPHPGGGKRPSFHWHSSKNESSESVHAAGRFSPAALAGPHTNFVRCTNLSHVKSSCFDCGCCCCANIVIVGPKGGRHARHRDSPASVELCRV
jgi:hypothetical protein